MAEHATTRLKRWQSRTELAKQLRSDWETRFQVKELELAFLGCEGTTDSDDITRHFNHFFATVQTQKPTLLPRSTHFLVKPKAGKKPFGTTESKTQEAVLKAIAEQDDNLYIDASLALAQAFFRVGVLKMAYDPRFEPNPRSGEPVPQGFTDQTAPGQDPSSATEPADVLTDEAYTFNWVDARKMLFPDAGPNMRTWPWIGEEIEISLEDAQDDPRFSHRRQLRANATARPQEVLPDYESQEDEYKRFCYTECWDIREKRHLAWATGQDFDGFLIDEDYEPGIEDHPYSILAFIPILGPDPSPWPKPVTFDWLSIQEDYDELRIQMVNAAKRNARKFLYGEGTFPDDEEVDKFTSAADMQGVRIADMTHPPMMFGEASQNADVPRSIPFLMNDWRIITGASGTRLGDPDANTATEAVLIEQSAGLRDSAAKLAVDKWLARAGAKMLQLIKQTMTLEMWVELRGFSDSEFQTFLQTPGFQTMLALQVGQENVPAYLAALEINPVLQERFKERLGTIKPLQVTRSRLQFEADVEVLPSAARPLQQAQLLRLASVLGPAAFVSPTFVEELLASFDLPQASRIAEEVLIGLRQQQQAQAQQPARGGGSNGSQTVLRQAGPLGAVGGRGGGI